MKHVHVRLMETIADFNNVENFADVNVNTNIDVKKTDISSSNTNASSTSTKIDNSQKNTSISSVATSTVNTQNTSNITNTDNSTKSNIVSSSTTSNVDNSSTSTVSDASSKVNNIMKCGLDASGAKDLIANINNSLNIDNNASNSFIATGNNNTISDVKLSSLLTSYGPSIDKSCVQKALSESQTKQDTTNSLSSSQAGAAFVSDLKTGGNITSTENITGSTNKNASESSSGSKASGYGTVVASTETSQTASSEQDSKQTSKQTASSMNGIREVNSAFILVMITFAVLFYMEKYQDIRMYSDILDNIKEHYHIYLLALVFVLSYLYNMK